MVLAIWKFPFGIARDITIDMPKGARLLHVDLQLGVPCLWAVVDPTAPIVARKLFLVGTGHPLPKKFAEASYIGTFQMDGGNLVWHLFDSVPHGKE